MSFDEVYQWLRSLWLVWLMALFIGIVVWTYWPKRKAEMEKQGRIPLEDGDEENR